MSVSTIVVVLNARLLRRLDLGRTRLSTAEPHGVPWKQGDDMSLIALTDRLRAGHSTARRLLLVIALTGAVIIGLLAMHSLNSHTAAGTSHHHADAAVISVADGGHDQTAAVQVRDVCADCDSDHSGMLAMACVLALLAVALLLVRPQLRRRWLSTMPGRQPVVAASGIRVSSRPPSLTALCVSRT